MRFERSVSLQVPREDLWPLISDTDRLNRRVGLPPVHFDELGQGVRQATARYGLTLRWIESPFEWSAPNFYSVERSFSSGPWRTFRGGVELEDLQGGTAARVWAEVEPRGLLGRIVAARGVGGFLDRTVEALRAFEGRLLGSRESLESSGTGRADLAALSEARERLLARGCPPETVLKLEQHLGAAPDEDVSFMKPYALADRWGRDRREVLETFLEGARAGVVQLRWTTVCPSCRGVKSDRDHLLSLKRQDSCATCSASFTNEFDRTVQARFDPHPAIRAVRRDRYCAGGPANTPHISAQVRLAPRSGRTFRVRLFPGRWLLRSPQAASTAELLVDPAASGARAAVRVAEALTADPGRAASGEVELAIENGLDREALLQVQSTEWDNDSVSAAEISTVQKFRDLFAEEAIEPGQEMGIGLVAFLFSDLAGSTALYDRIGDVPAYAYVRTHFSFMKERVRRNRGAVVKTMGDAVMAVFARPSDALAAALAVQGDAGSGDSARFHVKIGLHAGPCVVVGTDGIVDYFGTTVNLAQRVQSAARAGDVMMTESFLREARRGEALDATLEVTREELLLRGFRTPVALLRCRKRT